MKAHFYKMTCLTNLHVGNGDVNYSIVDNEVEKDNVLGGEAIIPSTGVKGALLSYIKENCSNISDINAMQREVFGDDNNRGNYKFLSAGLLARPVRVSEGEKAFVLASSQTLLRNYAELRSSLSEKSDIGMPEGENICFSDGVKKVEGNDIELEKRNMPEGEIKRIIGSESVILKDNILSDIKLPVAARNCLDDSGKSKNLWYEEYVPHHSVFYMIIITPEETNKIDQYINGKIVQFGANASVGYGLMKIERI